jgi:hypothetical protein
MKLSFIFLLLLSPISNIIAQYSTTFPLQTGNLWLYRNSYPLLDPVRVQRTVGDTTMPNGLTYTTVFDSTYSSQVILFYRQSGARVYQYGRFVAAQEQLVFDFSRMAGDTIASFRYGSDTCTITLTYRGFQNIFGMNREQWMFLINPTVRITDDETQYTITDSLGITSIIRFMYYYYVKGLLVDGRMYGTFTAVETDLPTLPNTIDLSQNFPNPFNPTTTIQFQLLRRSDVSLYVYDILGREVSNILGGIRGPGRYEVRFNADGLATGIYYYRLNADGQILTKKMMVTR